MQVLARLLLLFPGSLLPALQGSGVPATAGPSASPFARVEAPDLALWLAVRARAEAAPGADEGLLAEPVARCRALAEGLGSPLLLLRLDAQAVEGRTLAGMRARFEALPADQRVRRADGTVATVATRALALAVLDALGSLPADERAAWDAARAEEASRRWGALEAALGALPGGADAPLAAAAATLDLPRERARKLPVLLVDALPAPGGVTLRTAAGPVSLVASGGRSTDELAEVVVHEALHQLEEQAAPDAPHAGLPARLDAALAAAGLDARDPRRRNATHALLFLAAADAVRASLAPDHRDVGTVEGSYARLGPFLPALRAAWSARGTTGEATFLARAVEAVTAAPASAGPARRDGGRSGPGGG